MRKIIQQMVSIMIGFLLAGLVWLVSSPPRGEPARLYPAPTLPPLVIHVIGAVQQEGVYELPKGSRVGDVIELAGGALPQADLTGINLSARLLDGMQIRIVTRVSAEADSPSASTVVTPTPPVSDEQAADQSQISDSGMVNINTAGPEELQTLPGIGPVTAEKIIAHRTENGPFENIADIVNVAGIGPATFDRIKGSIEVTQ